MNINHTVLKTDGKPAFVVLPYADYKKLISGVNHTGRIPADGSTPHEVMRMCVKNNWSMIRAWREHLGLTQAEMAQRLEIRQPSYAAMESLDANLKKTTRKRIAAAIGISIEQLEF